MNGPVNGEAGDVPGGVPGGGEHGEWLSEVLDSEFARYEPDSRRIRTLLDERMEGGRGGRRAGGPAARLRLTGIPAGIAAAALCAALAVTVTATVVDNHPDSAANAAANNGGGLPAAGTGPNGGRSSAGSPGTGTQGTLAEQGAGAATKGTAESGSGNGRAGDSGKPSAPASASASPQNGGDVLSGVTGSLGPTSNQSWTEEDVRMTLTAPVTALQLTIRVSPNVQLTPSNDWSTYNITAYDVQIDSGSGGLIYTFTLKPGKTIPTGPLTIAVQFTHNRQRDASGDTYELSVTTDQAHGSTSAGAQGSF